MEFTIYALKIDWSWPTSTSVNQYFYYSIVLSVDGLLIGQTTQRCWSSINFISFFSDFTFCSDFPNQTFSSFSVFAAVLFLVQFVCCFGPLQKRCSSNTISFQNIPINIWKRFFWTHTTFISWLKWNDFLIKTFKHFYSFVNFKFCVPNN